MDKSLFNLENDDMGMSIISLIEKEGSFYGTIAELLERLKQTDPDFDQKYWTSKRAGKKISKMWSHLCEMFDAEEEKNIAVRKIRIQKKNTEKLEPKPDGISWDDNGHDSSGHPPGNQVNVDVQKNNDPLDCMPDLGI